MNVYVYEGELYCEDCGMAIREEIVSDDMGPADPDNDWSYPSNIFPKGPYLLTALETDCLVRCASGANCLNGIVLPDGKRVGVRLENRGHGNATSLKRAVYDAACDTLRIKRSEAY